MFTESRKIHLLEEVLRTSDEATLVEIEAVLKNKKMPAKKKKPSIYDFVGILSKKESGKMRKAIEETCETVDPDDWK